MCFKKWFEKSSEVVPIVADRVALLFGINDYRGGDSDLRGCLNDIDDVEKKLKSEFPDFKIRKLKDAEVTVQRFIGEIESALINTKKVLYLYYSGHGTKIGKQEALYLINGPLMDDVICDLQNKTPDYLKVTAKFDSCFAAGMADRTLNPRYIKSKFYVIPGVRIEQSDRHFGRGDSQKWIIFAGCDKNETSADAEFSGRANGAFTYFDLRSYNASSNYFGEIDKLLSYLPGSDFDQTPKLLGDEEHFAEQVLT
jgi:hypothetical protein